MYNRYRLLVPVERGIKKEIVYSGSNSIASLVPFYRANKNGKLSVSMFYNLHICSIINTVII